MLFETEHTIRGLKPPPNVKTWLVTKLSFMALSDPVKLNPLDKKFLDFLFSYCGIIKEAAELANQFKKLFQIKEVGSLQKWIDRAIKSESGLKTFAKGILSDFQAVDQAFVSTISNGQVEGQVNKLKTIKRPMYGRAGFELLRTMILAN